MTCYYSNVPVLFLLKPEDSVFSNLNSTARSSPHPLMLSSPCSTESYFPNWRLTFKLYSHILTLQLAAAANSVYFKACLCFLLWKPSVLLLGVQQSHFNNRRGRWVLLTCSSSGKLSAKFWFAGVLITQSPG